MTGKLILDFTPIKTCTCCGGPKKGAPNSKALVVSVHGRTHLLAHIGADIDYEIESVGTDHTLQGLEDGIWVLECRIRSWTSYEGEHDYELEVLEQRPVTKEEWEGWVEGEEEPWDEMLEDYYHTGKVEECPVHGAQDDTDNASPEVP